MMETTKQTLLELADVLQASGQSAFTRETPLLRGATIGQHVRHTIELFECLLQGYAMGYCCYDNRKRNQQLSTDLDFAILQLHRIANQIERDNKDLSVTYDLHGNEMIIPSNYYRELMYNLEHCIHHNAIIRIALSDGPSPFIPDNFGVAPSTIKYRQVCAH